MSKVNRKVVCLTPVKNEAWILDTFLKSTSIWADYIIIADQGSTDDSVKIATSYDKVILVKNKNTNYNEVERQKLLIAEARKIEGNNILIALDADEILVNFDDTKTWESIQNADIGTCITFPWLNVLPGNKSFYTFDPKKVLGKIDDGREHTGKIIHSTRVPFREEDKILDVPNFKVLHFQFSHLARLRSKHRWYEALERIKFPDKSNIDIFRLYHHIDLEKQGVTPIDSKWLACLQNKGVTLDIQDDEYHWWDVEMLIFFEKYGANFFKKQYIWYINWNDVQKKYLPNSTTNVNDPRNALDKLVHRWLYISQSNQYSFKNRTIERVLRMIKW